MMKCIPFKKKQQAGSSSPVPQEIQVPIITGPTREQIEQVVDNKNRVVIVQPDLLLNVMAREPFASGASAMVYRGLLPANLDGKEIPLENQNVAIKLFRRVPHHHTLLNELQVLQVIEPHNNIISLVGVVSVEEDPGIILRYASRGTLSDNLHKEVNGPLSLERRIEIIKGISSALYHVHELKYVMYDLKPDNILLDENFVPKLADFGMAERDGDELNFGGGTFGYSDPAYIEARMNEVPIRAQAQHDVYSFGITLLEILYGESGWIDPKNMKPNIYMKFKAKSMDERVPDHRMALEMNDDNQIKLELLWALADLCCNENEQSRLTAERICKYLERPIFQI